MGQILAKRFYSLVFAVTALVCVAAPALMLGCTGDDDNFTRVAEVVLLQYDDQVPIHFDALDYQVHFFDDSGTYRSTPGGQDIFGSLREWFLWVSNGRFQFTGYVNPTVLRAQRPWSEVMDLQRQYEADRATGQWWVASLHEDAHRALGRSWPPEPGSVPAENTHGLVIVNNGYSAPSEGWAVGDVVVLKAMSLYRADIVSLGLSAHEISHLFTGQPDRYTFQLGVLGIWDVMAVDYDNFPAPYTMPGLIDAGWAQYAGNVHQDGVHHLDVVPSLDTASVSRFKARANELGAASQAFTMIENRRPRLGEDPRLYGPKDGMMLWTTDPSEPWAWSLIDLNPASFARLHAHSQQREYSKVWRILEDWAVSDEDLALGSEGFTCANGRSLNILGECLWEFRVDAPASVLDSGADLSRNVRAESKSLALQLTRETSEVMSAVLEPAQMTGSRRLYYVARGPSRVKFRSLSGELITVHNVQSSNELITVQNVAELPQESEAAGGTLLFEGQIVGEPTVVERPLKSTQAGVQVGGSTRIGGQTAVMLDNGEQWSASQVSIGVNQNTVISIPPLPENAYDEDRNAYVRLTLAYGTAEFGAGFGDEAAEDTDRVILRHVYSAEFTLIGDELFNMVLSSQRREPFVVYAKLQVPPHLIMEPVYIYFSRITGGGALPRSLYVLSIDVL